MRVLPRSLLSSTAVVSPVFSHDVKLGLMPLTFLSTQSY